MRLARLITALWLVASVATGAIRFEEIARKAGVRSNCATANGQFHQIELTAGGVAVLDYNNDGCTEFSSPTARPFPSLRKTGPEFYNRLFRNNCDMTFTDVTAEAGRRRRGLFDGGRRRRFRQRRLSPISSSPA